MPEQVKTAEVTTAETVVAAVQETVGAAEYQRVLADATKHKAEAKKFQVELETKRVDEMKKANEWESLAKLREEKLTALEADNTRMKESFVNEKKFSAVKVLAVAAGLRKEALSDLDLLELNSVMLETTSTGKMNVLGAERFVESLKTSKPHWFAAPTAPNVNTDGVTVVDSMVGPVTVEMIMAAEKESLKTGDKSKYHDLHNKYRKQPGRMA